MRFWRKRKESAEKLEQAEHKLELVEQDDARVARLAKRTARLIAENNLAPAVMKALGAQGR
jgi:Trk K+ transport system NAD-binding subunit